MRVFRNRETLLHDYTPSRLPHREKELEDLRKYFEPVLRENFSLKIHVNGKIGTGKTVLCKRLGRILEREASKIGRKLKFVYINLAYAPKPYHAMLELHEQVAGSPALGLSPEQMLASVVKAVIKKDCRLVVVLDEVDTYIMEGRDPKIFYMLPRVYELNEKAAGMFSLIYVSRSFDWMKRLDGATLDTLGRTLAVHLKDYGLPEVRDIAAYRADVAYMPGAVEEDVINFVAHISMGYGGVRYALELLLGAGSIAERDGSSSVRAEHVRAAHAGIPKGVNGAIYPDELSLHKQLLMKGVMDALKATGNPYLTFKDAYAAYAVNCEWCGVEPEDENVILSYLKDLSLEGYILLKSEGEWTVVGMEYPFNRFAEVLERTLKRKEKVLFKH